MRLINTTTFAFEEFMDESTIPAYAILSHTWGVEEVTFQDMRDGISDAIKQKAGFAKIKLACQQAESEGFALCWVDTCCIDKTSSAELSEAINSMFRWYGRSSVCYAYLSDVKIHAGAPANFAGSRWFTRGWTLQELIAPHTIEFYGSGWVHLGSSSLLAASLSGVTGIDIEIFDRQRPLHEVCVARRMSWAAMRCTTRVEDVAYSLLGIFGVNMPLLYGEGEKAFHRLQEQIIRESGDDSILAWDFQYESDHRSTASQLLAPSPEYFRGCSNVHHCRPIRWDDTIDLTNNGLRLRTHYLNGTALSQLVQISRTKRGEVAILNCYRGDAPDLRFALRLQRYIQHSDSGEKAYSVYPESRTLTAEGVMTGERSASHTRLILVDRSGGQASVTRETNLITKRMLDQQIKFTLNTTTKNAPRLKFLRALRLAHSSDYDNRPSLLGDFTPHPSQTFEFVKGNTWSASVSAPSRPKFIVGGAKFQDELTGKFFFLVTMFQNPHIAPQQEDDGDCGVMLLPMSSDTKGPHDDFPVFLGLLRTSYESARSKKATLKLRGGTVTAIANVSDFEGMMMNVTVSFIEKRSPASAAIQPGGKSERIDKRLAKLMSRREPAVKVQYDD